MSHITRHTSHITHHTSHITHHTSHITHHTSHITRASSTVPRTTTTAFKPPTRFISYLAVADALQSEGGSGGSHAAALHRTVTLPRACSVQCSEGE